MTPPLGVLNPFIINPEQTSTLFAYHREISAVKGLLDIVLHNADPKLKTGVDVCWLVYKGFKLSHDYQRLGKITPAFGFELAGDLLSAVNVIDKLTPAFDIPDPYTNGIDFIIGSGDALYRGEIPRFDKMLMSYHENGAILNKVGTLIQYASDTQPSTAELTTRPITD